MSALSLQTLGMLPDTASHIKTALHLQTLGQLHTLEAVIQPTPTQPSQSQPRFVSVGGGRRPLVPVPPHPMQFHPLLDPLGDAPSLRDVQRRAKTLTASVGVVVEDGDRAHALAATLALLLDDIKGR